MDCAVNDRMILPIGVLKMRTTTMTIALISAFAIARPVLALADCSADVANVEKAARAGTSRDVEALVQKLGIACAPAEKLQAKGLLSQKLILEAKQIDPAFRDARAVALLDKAVAVHVDWHAFEIKGRLERAASRFQAATEAFQIAINLVADGDADKASDADNKGSAPVWSNDATKAERANLAREADETKHLAAAEQGVLVVAPTDRDGNPGGELSGSVDRGAVGVQVPAPILFEFNSAKLTKVGTDAAQEIAAFLKERNPQTITVTGHTDHVGGEAFNMELSRKRAATIAAFLKDQNVSARIVTVGKGFSEPWKLSEGATYTQSRIDELNRRVEFSWN
jgi:outer membrane protein OmpA-like peptidoglycan-associated protein